MKVQNETLNGPIHSATAIAVAVKYKGKVHTGLIHFAEVNLGLTEKDIESKLYGLDTENLAGARRQRGAFPLTNNIDQMAEYLIRVIKIRSLTNCQGFTWMEKGYKAEALDYRDFRAVNRPDLPFDKPSVVIDFDNNKMLVNENGVLLRNMGPGLDKTHYAGVLQYEPVNQGTINQIVAGKN